jgi:hypothetical protein
MKFIGPEAATVAMGILVAVVAVEVMDIEGVVDSEVMDVDEEEDMHVAEHVDAAQMSPKMLHLPLSHSPVRLWCSFHTWRFFLLVLRHKWRTGMLQHCMCYNGWIAWLARIERGIHFTVYSIAAAFSSALRIPF